MRLLLCAAAAACITAPAAAQSVASEDGNIVYTAADGTRRQLTRCGGDVEPALSPDGATVVFVRVPLEMAMLRGDPFQLRPSPPPGACRHPVHTPLTEDERRFSELMAVDVRTGEERVLHWDIASAAPWRPLGYARPRFPTDLNLVHFSDGHGGVFALELDSRRMGMIPRPGMLAERNPSWWEVIRSGPLRGYLLVEQPVIGLDGTERIAIWLNDPWGIMVREITEGVEAFRAANVPR